MKTAVAIRHVHFEDLGSFEPVLKRAGYQIYYLDAGLHDLKKLDPLAADLLFVLGAPIGVYDGDLYPFLADEFSILKIRIAADKPTLGICLGAQLIAAALGAQVYPSGTKEIGFAKISLSEDGRNSPLRHLENVEVLHWHGDTFDLPSGSVLLASSEAVANQAFSLGRHVLGLQFHAEADSARIERWLIGHACELTGAKIDPRKVRADSESFGAALAAASDAMLSQWLQRLD